MCLNYTYFMLYCIFFSLYLEEGFLHLQNIVGTSIITFKANRTLEPMQVSVRQLPYPNYRSDPLLVESGTLLPIIIVVSLIFSAGIFTKVSVIFVHELVDQNHYQIEPHQYYRYVFIIACCTRTAR